MAQIRENSIVRFEKNTVVSNQGFGRVLKVYQHSCLVEILISNINNIVVKEYLNKMILSKKDLEVYSEQRMIQSELYKELKIKESIEDGGG